MRMSDGSSDVCSSDHGRRQARPGHRQVRRMRSSPVHEQQAALAAAWQAAPRVAVLLPCYDEEAAIGQVVSAVRRALPEAMIYVYDRKSVLSGKSVSVRVDTGGRRNPQKKRNEN